jgi:chorismate-pyruvate lyase
MLGLYGATANSDIGLVRPALSWPDTRQARSEIDSRMDRFEARLLVARTATAALEAWCAERKLAIDGTIKARIVTGTVKPPTEEQRLRLQIGADEPTTYRRVELVCGEHVLSEADNWYVPSRLTAEMNATVETTDTPFGRAVAALSPYRRTISVARLWEPVTPDASNIAEAPARVLEIPLLLLENRALVFTGDGVPFAEVCETYTRNILGLENPAFR